MSWERNRCFSSHVCGVIAICLVLAAPGTRNGNLILADDSDARVRFLMEGFVSNRSSFIQYRCSLSVRQGHAPSLQSAVAHGPSSDVVTGTARIVKDGDSFCSTVETNDQPRPTGAANQVAISLSPFLFVGNTEKVLSFSVLAGGGVLSQRDSAQHMPIEFDVWNQVMMGEGAEGCLDKWIANRLSAGIPFTVEECTQQNGLESVKVSCRSGEVYAYHCVDEMRGFIPVEAGLAIGGQDFGRFFTTDIRACSRHRFFPTRCVTVWLNGGDGNGSVRAREIVVTDLALDSGASDSELSITLPAGSSVNNVSSAQSVVFFDNDTQVTPHDIDQLDTLTQRAVEERVTRAEEVSDGQSRRWFLAGLCGVLLVAAGFAIMRVRR